MRLAFILPTQELEEEVVERVLSWVKKRFPEIDDFRVAVIPEKYEYYKGLFPNLTLQLYDKEALDRYCDILVFMKGTYHISSLEPYADDLSKSFSSTVYSVRREGKLSLVNRSINEEEYPHLNKHVFNKLAEKEGSRYGFFPYGYIFRYTGVGPLDPFGFRIDFDYHELESREPNHKVIAVFGGSTSFSIRCLHEEMFSYRLEEMLNDYCRKNHCNLKFTVLNFGQLSHCVLNEMLTYLLFADPVTPDYVIAHDGYNDMVCGMISDSYLLNKFKITYQDVMEQWGQLLHNSFDVSIMQDTIPYDVVNLPQNIVNAYIERKQQFCRVVQSNGGKFIWGQQSFITSKKALAKKEKETFPLWLDGHIHSEVIKKIPFVYDKLIEALIAKDIDFINLHEYFHRFDETVELFNDHIHTTPLGDEYVAEFYFNYFKEIIGNQEI